VNEAIQKLANTDLDTAELIYLRFNSQRPHLIKFLIPKYVEKRLSNNSFSLNQCSFSDPERFAQLLRHVKPFLGIEEIIADLPSKFMTPNMVALLQNAVEEYDHSRANLHLRTAIGNIAKENTVEKQKKAQSICARFSFGDKCNVCKNALNTENISFLHNNPVHSRCLRKV
jgi:hypothetical protein